MTTRILPDRASPPDVIPRRHTPRTGAYEVYRDCLRWEFAFTCPFCLSHESDFVAFGAAGSGLMSIEHRVPRSDATDGKRLENDYANCFYACRFCNAARSNRPILDARGRRLLDPTSTPWSAHFQRVANDLDPVGGDVDAAYTSEAYDLNDARKVKLRELRELNLVTSRRALAELPLRIAKLETKLARQPSAAGLELHRDLQQMLQRAHQDLARYAVQPSDCPASCRCESQHVCALPPHAGR